MADYRQGVVAAIALLLLTEVAYAVTGGEGESATAASPVKRSRMLEEVMVTAQRRVENIADVPVAVQAFSGDKMDAMGITDLDSLQASIPTLNVGTNVSFTTIFLRGVGTNAFLTGDPSVAYYIDGIYFPFAFRLSQNFGKVERLEVLKGPQGTTFGRNAVGGAISVTTEEPGFDELSGQFQASYGSFDEVKSRLYVNGPLTDSLAISGTLFQEQREQYGEVVMGGLRADDQTEEGGRVQLLWQPSDQFSLKGTYFRIDSDGPGGTAVGNQQPSALCVALGCTPQEGHDIETSIPIFSKTENEVYHGIATINTDWMDIKLRASDQFVFQNSTVDFDGTPAPGPVFGTYQIGDYQTAEIQFLSNGSSWQSDWIDWVGGIYYLEGITGYKPITFAASSLLDTTNQFGDPNNVVGGTLGPIVGLLGDLGLPAQTGVIIQDSLIGTEAISFYGQFTVNFTDYFAVTIGGRYQEEERYIIRIKTDLLGADGSRTPVLDGTNNAVDRDGNPAPSANTDTSFTPKISLEWRPFYSASNSWVGEDTLMFFSYQQATKAATYNAVPVLAPPTFVESEELDAYEIGIKSSLFNGLMTVSASAFHYKIENLQAQLISLLASGATALQNIPESEINGFDFDATVQLFPSLVDDLVLAIGGGYLDTEYLDFDEAQGYNEAGFYSDAIDVTGGEIYFAPDVTLTATLSKTWQLFGNPLEAAVDYYKSSQYYLTAENNDVFVEDGYSTMGARLSYFYEPWQLRTTVYGQNITDEEYITGCICNDFGFVRNIGPPERYGLQVTVDF